MSKICRWFAPFLFLLGLCHPALGNDFSGVYVSALPGHWPGGQVTWQYSSTDKPANVTDAEVIALIQKAMAAWGSACQVQGVYNGTTSTSPYTSTPTDRVVVGWHNYTGDSAQFTAFGLPASSDPASGYTRYTGGAVIINTAQNVRSLIDSGSLYGVIQHELGHVLGFAHSEDPYSIMFANPYGSGVFQSTLQGDDIRTCADVYGDKGVVANVDHRNDTVTTGPSVVNTITTTQPDSTTPVAYLDGLDTVSGAYYFDIRWHGLTLGTQVQARWIAPNGAIYQQSNVLSSSYANGYLYFNSTSLPLYLTGTWAFQTLMDGKLVASQAFTVSRSALSSPGQLEAAVVAERGSNGQYALRTVNYGSLGITQWKSYAQDATAAAVTSFTPVAGANSLDTWFQSNQSRYKPSQSDGQPPSSFDSVRRTRFTTDASGNLATSGLSVAQTGTPMAYFASATAQIAQSGQFGFYVLVVLNGQTLFRTPSGWTTSVQPLLTVQAPAVVTLDLLRNVDLRLAPAGTALYVAYGRTPEEAVSQNQYLLVRTQ